MTLTLLDQRRLAASFQVRNVVRNEVGQLGVLDMAPADFDRIELRGVSRQPLKFSAYDFQGFDPRGGRAMHAPVIQADDQRPPQARAKFLDEGDHMVRADVGFVDLKGRAGSTPRGREGRCADKAQSVVAIPRPLNGRLACQRLSAAICRLQAEARFIDKSNRSPAPLGFFLMRAAMRAHVHKSVRYLAARGPASTISISSSRCWSLSLLLPPGWGLAERASTPPACRAAFQRFTLERLTPNSWAMVRTTSLPGNPLQRDDELPAPPHCLMVSCSFIRC